MINELPSEGVALIATIDPAENLVAATVSDYGDIGKFASMLALLQLGVIGAAATIDMKLVQATDASGTGKKDITGKAITQLVKATDDDKQAMINVRAEDLDIDNDFSFVAIELTVGAAISQSSCALLGFGARYKPASDENLASVAEIV